MMIRILALLGIAAVAVACGGPDNGSGGEALQPDEMEASALAATCAACHGTTGESLDPNVPSLAGLTEDYFVSRMRDFREEQDSVTVMHQLAKGYSEEEARLIAAHFVGADSSGGDP